MPRSQRVSAWGSPPFIASVNGAPRMALRWPCAIGHAMVVKPSSRQRSTRVSLHSHEAIHRAENRAGRSGCSRARSSLLGWRRRYRTRPSDALSGERPAARWPRLREIERKPRLSEPFDFAQGKLREESPTDGILLVWDSSLGSE